MKPKLCYFTLGMLLAAVGGGSAQAQVNLNIGTLPSGDRITIKFEVIIDDPLPTGTTSISNQGVLTFTAKGTEGAVLTDDPETVMADDPTVTPVSPGPPALAITRTGGKVTISWETATPGFVLESTDSLLPPAWINAPSGGMNPVTLPVIGPQKVFRLKEETVRR